MNSLLIFLALAIAVEGSVVWEKHENKNCWGERQTWRGAETMKPNPWKFLESPGKWKTSFTLSECQQECARDSTCEGIVIRRGKAETGGPCYKRRGIQPDRCIHKPGSDLYIRKEVHSESGVNCDGQNSKCASDEFCVLDGVRSKTLNYRCAKKLPVGARCEDDSWCSEENGLCWGNRCEKKLAYGETGCKDDSWCLGKNAICRADANGLGGPDKCYAPKGGYQDCNPEDGQFACDGSEDIYDEYGTKNSCVEMEKGYAGLDYAVWECRPPNDQGK